ncbi:hypothetical protein AWH56_011255 [Anaerobacillus isosaccharinicus]|uniref:Uncharacterized protein n=1 Tax=Anaerobacillus isosaccharinicus TaxID=1532552 RepID=A0A7S7RDJ7_9BACI|nr:hypothetical protein [Anaerobacillus isosaccharinicus]MBA5588518.1 hypothetical protein [Anaerobacillus isosaccharinicus]QOY38060.1 hypothetical protein AWH56_011255 [Anaerobacillus isosaccharinicus]
MKTTLGSEYYYNHVLANDLANVEIYERVTDLILEGDRTEFIMYLVRINSLTRNLKGQTGQFFYDLTIPLDELYNLSKIDTEKVVLEEKIGELKEKIIIINSVLQKMQENLGFDHKLWYEEINNNDSTTNQMLREQFEVYMNSNAK